MEKVIGQNCLAKHPFYRAWCQMKGRCLTKSNPRYKDYGGRGISISKEWLDYDVFEQDMYESWWEHVEKYGQRNTSIERIDNNGGYCKENCKWATMHEQNNNRRRRQDARLFSFNGETLSLPEWSKITGIKVGTLYARIMHYGWGVDRALTER